MVGLLWGERHESQAPLGATCALDLKAAVCFDLKELRPTVPFSAVGGPGGLGFPAWRLRLFPVCVLTRGRGCGLGSPELWFTISERGRVASSNSARKGERWTLHPHLREAELVSHHHSLSLSGPYCH